MFSTIAGLVLMVADTFVARATPVAKIDNRSFPFDGSNGPVVKVSASRMMASPWPSPVMVNKPGAAGEIVASAFDDRPSAVVTRNSAGPFANSAGTTMTTSSADA